MTGRNRHFLFGGVVALSLLHAGSAISAPCLDWDQSRSLAAKAVQTRLMVAALSCGLRDQYNAFVSKFDRELVGHNSALMDWHRQNYGSGADRAYHNLMTRIANEASADNISATRQFCRQAGETLSFYLTASSQSISAMLPTSVTSRRYGIAACRSLGNDYEIRGSNHSMPVIVQPDANSEAE